MSGSKPVSRPPVTVTCGTIADPLKRPGGTETLGR